MTRSPTPSPPESHAVPYFRSTSLRKSVTKGSDVTALHAQAIEHGKSSYHNAVDDMDGDTDDGENYEPLRGGLVHLFQLKKVDLLLAIVIFANLGFLVVETDYAAKDQDSPGWIKVANMILLIFYSIEIGLRMFAFRRRFFESKANVFDLTIVFIDLVFVIIDAVAAGSMDLPSVAYLRLFRMLRLGRTMKVLVMFPELTRMVNGLLSACGKVMWGGLLLIIILFLWALLAVQIIHPLNKKIADAGQYEGRCSRCPRAYESVFQASVTIVQNLVAGDSWGQVNVVIVEEYPTSLIFFSLMLLSLGLIMLNLITAMIVDGAQDARQQEDRTLAQLKDQAYEDATLRLQSLCETIDTDGGGTLTRDELKNGFDTNADFQNTLKILDISKGDIDVLFDILDTDKSGDIDYSEFVEQMHKMRCDDMHTLVVFIKYYVTEVHSKVEDQMRILKDQFSLPDDLSCRIPLEPMHAGATKPNSWCPDAKDGVCQLMLTEILNQMAIGIMDQQKQFAALCNVFSHPNDSHLPLESKTLLESTDRAALRSPRARDDDRTFITTV